MDGDESAALTSYYHHHHPQPTTTTTSSTANGVFSSDRHQHSNQSTTTPHYEQPTPLTYPTQQHSLRPPPPQPQPPPLTSPPPPASSQHQPIAPPPESVKRKRGRPRKYGTPETPQSAVKKLLSSSPSGNLPSPQKKDGSLLSSSKKNQLVALGNAGQNFVPHIITVTAGEDIYQKIMSFTQQRKRAVCILSASGSISNASLRQPATLGGTVTYEGRFEILSLSGSYLHTETEGGGSTRKGGLSVCLSDTNGRIVGGGVGGPLTAAGPVQVIIGSFVVEANKETNLDVKYETSSSSKLPQVIGTTFSSVVYNNDHQNFGVNNYVFQTQGMHSMPSQSPDWRDNTDLGACQSSEDGDDGDLHH